MKKYYIKQKIFTIGDKYNIFDENQNLVYYVKGEIFTLTSKLHLFSKKTDREIFFIKRKFFTFLPQYDMFKNDELVASVFKKFTVFSHNIRIESNYGDFDVQGNFLSHDFVINKSGEKVAEIHKKWLSWGDAYEILISEDENYEFYLALVIMIDNCIHNENNNSNNNN
ncbi:MAG: LURP-one-related family protein [Bacilli bacterium]|nr:LURP-one-related family protein [Bacilli bacterium]